MVAHTELLDFIRCRLGRELHSAAVEAREDGQAERAVTADRERARRDLDSVEIVKDELPLWLQAKAAREDDFRCRLAHTKFMSWRQQQRTRRCGQILRPYFTDSASRRNETATD